MNTTRLKQFRKAFASHEWSSKERRIYAKKWVASLRHLGSKWLLSPAESKEKESTP